MSRIARLRWLAAVALAVIASACAGTADEIITFDDVPTAIVIDTESGDVIVNANVAVSGVRIESAVDNTVISADLVDGVLTISDDCSGDGCSVNYFVQMRGDVSVEVTTTSGTISVTDIAGDAGLASDTGGITLNAVAGSATATTGDASIIATRMESALAEFRAEVGDIDVTFDEPVEVLVVETGSGDVRAQLPDGSYAIDATTADGSTDLVLESEPESDKMVTLTTGEGDITVYRR